jgi:anaphase-promoting complex subunit 7
MLFVSFQLVRSSRVVCVTFTSQMEGIPSKARNLPMNLLLGKLYRISRHSRAAVAIYKECLRFVK